MSCIFYLKYSGTPNHGNMFGNYFPVGSAQQNNRKLPKIFGLPTIKEYVMHICLHKVFPGMLRIVMSNGMVPPLRSYLEREFCQPSPSG